MRCCQNVSFKIIFKVVYFVKVIGDHSAYRSYTIHLANYESINGMMFPKKISTQLSGDHIVDIEISDIQFNLGISDFFFKAIPF